MSDKYLVSKFHIEELNFDVLILEIPEEELLSKLETFNKYNGAISSNHYEDFLLANFVANISLLIQKFKQHSDKDFDKLDLKNKLIDEIIKINKKLDPKSIAITSDNTLVLDKTPYNLNKGEILLIKNSSWDSLHKEEKKEENSIKSKSLKDLEFIVEKKWWKRLNKYVKIKKFNEADLEPIIGGKYFNTRTSLYAHIVRYCVVDIDDLVLLLDELGVPNKATVPIPLLMFELYTLCTEINPFLIYENLEKYFEQYDKQNTFEDQEQCSSSCKKPAKGSTSSSSSFNKKKKRFKEVPKEDLLNLAANMKVSLIGQDAAVDCIADAIQRASVGLKDPVKPIGSFLLAGKSGTGKTLTSKILADSLIKDRDNLITIDCSEYSEDHEYSKLIGAPAGYIGADKGGILTNAILKSPFSVVVFDEVEKASHKLHQLLLQILEEGRLTDGTGNTVYFKDCVIILTSNVGVAEVENIKKTIGFGDVAVVTEEKKNNEIEKAIKNKFKPEFLNRLDKVVYFRDLTEEDYKRIVDLELYKLNDNLKANDTDYRSLFLNFDETLIDYIYKNGVNPEYGARPLKRCIENEVVTPLAKYILTTDQQIIKNNIRIWLDQNKETIAFEFFEEKVEESLLDNLLVKEEFIGTFE